MTSDVIIFVSCRSDTVRYALDILSILTVVPKTQLLLSEAVAVVDEGGSSVSTIGRCYQRCYQTFIKRCLAVMNLSNMCVSVKQCIIVMLLNILYKRSCLSPLILCILNNAVQQNLKLLSSYYIESLYFICFADFIKLVPSCGKRCSMYYFLSRFFI